MKAIIIFIAFFISQAISQPPCVKGEGNPGFDGGEPPCVKHGRHGGFGGHKGFLSPRMLAELDLSDSQKEAMREFRTDTKKEMIDLRGKIEKIEVDLWEEFTRFPLDESKIENLKKKISGLKAELTGKRIDGMLFLHSQLSQEQHEKLIQLREERGHWRKFSGKGGRGKKGQR